MEPQFLLPGRSNNNLSRVGPSSQPPLKTTGVPLKVLKQIKLKKAFRLLHRSIFLNADVDKESAKVASTAISKRRNSTIIIFVHGHVLIFSVNETEIQKITMNHWEVMH